MDTKYTTSTLVLTFAKQAMRELREQRAAYERDCAEWAEQGYRPHYCFHGTNLWTDYDNICGPCEDGRSDYEVALMLGRSRADHWQKMYDAAVSAHGLFSQEVQDALFSELLSEYKRSAGSE